MKFLVSGTHTTGTNVLASKNDLHGRFKITKCALLTCGDRVTFWWPCRCTGMFCWCYPVDGTVPNSITWHFDWFLKGGIILKINSKADKWIWSISGIILTGENWKYLRNPFLYHFVHNKTYTKWPGIEPKCPWWQWVVVNNLHVHWFITNYIFQWKIKVMQ